MKYNFSPCTSDLCKDAVEGSIDSVSAAEIYLISEFKPNLIFRLETMKSV